MTLLADSSLPRSFTEPNQSGYFAAALTFTAFGVRVRVQSDDPAVLDDLRGRLPPGWKPAAVSRVDRSYAVALLDCRTTRAAAPRYALWSDGEQLHGDCNGRQVREMLAVHVRLFLAEYAPRRVFVHAGVVGWGSTAIMVSGPSLAGKTTLVAEMIKRGATYYSDDYAVLDRNGRVHPYLKHLSIREDGCYEQQDVAVEKLGGRPGKQPLIVGTVLVCCYRAGARWQPRRLTPGEAVLELLANTVSARRQPERALHVLEKVAVGATTLKGVRGESSELLDEFFNIGQNGT